MEAGLDEAEGTGLQKPQKLRGKWTARNSPLGRSPERRSPLRWGRWMGTRARTCTSNMDQHGLRWPVVRERGWCVTEIPMFPRMCPGQFWCGFTRPRITPWRFRWGDVKGFLPLRLVQDLPSVEAALSDFFKTPDLAPSGREWLTGNEARGTRLATF